MNQDKIGKYIAELRKKNNLTQEQLGEKVGVNGKSVSKWERGLNIPTFANIEALASVFGITISELLQTEKKDSKEINEEFLAESVKFYNKKKRKIFLKISIFVILLSIMSFFVLFFINNYNKNRVYNIISLNSEYSIRGYIFYSQERNIILINKLDYQGNLVGTSDEPYVKKIKVYILGDQGGMYSYENEYFEPLLYSEALSDFSLNIEEIKGHRTNLLDYDSDMSKLTIYIEYDNEQNKTIKEIINLDVEELFSNNRIFY